MGRLEKNIRRKKRRRNMVFSLLAILLLFILGIGITNKIMVQMTAISPEQDILSAHNINVCAGKVKEIATSTGWFTDILVILREWIDRVQKQIGEMAGRI